MNTLQRLARRAETFAALAAYEAAIAVISRRRGVPPDVVRRVAARPLAASRARQEAIYLALVRFEVPLRVLARAANLDVAACSRACRKVELRREDRDYDRILDELELELMA